MAAPRSESIVPVALDQTGAQCCIRLEGEVDISSAAELKKLLFEALASGKDLRVDLCQATALDVTVLQLLLVLERETKRSKVNVVLAAGVQEDFFPLLAEAGFENFPIPIEPRTQTE